MMSGWHKAAVTGTLANGITTLKLGRMSLGQAWRELCADVLCHILHVL